MAQGNLPPWAEGAAEVFRHADEHFRQGGDTDRRLALIGFDNAIEVCIDTFVSLHPRNRRNYQIGRDDKERILQNYHTKMEFLERYASEGGVSLGDTSIDALIWYHQLRNELYHSGNGMTPERKHLVAIREAAAGVFQALFSYVIGSETGSGPGVSALTATREAPPDTSGNLSFLSAYIEFERALSGWFKPSKTRYVPQLWRDYSDANPWAQASNDLVERARRARNAVAHGEDRSQLGLTDAALDELAQELTALTRLVRERPLEHAPQRRGLRGRGLADAAHAIAQRVDQEMRGLTTLEIIDALTAEGIAIAGDDAGRAVYDALNAAKDRFERVSGGRYRWLPSGIDVGGLSGTALIAALEPLDTWFAEAPEGRHYQEVVARLEGDGMRVKGPDKGRTMNGALNGSAGRRRFVRAGRGRYRLVGQHPQAPALRRAERQIRAPSSQRELELVRFWQVALPVLAGSVPAFASARPRPYPFLTKSAQGVTLRANIKTDNASVWAIVGNSSGASANERFGRLAAHKDEVEARFGGRLGWATPADVKVPFVWATASTRGLNDRDAWPAITRELASTMRRLADAVHPFL